VLAVGIHDAPFLRLGWSWKRWIRSLVAKEGVDPVEECQDNVLPFWVGRGRPGSQGESLQASAGEYGDNQDSAGRSKRTRHDLPPEQPQPVAALATRGLLLSIGVIFGKIEDGESIRLYLFRLNRLLALRTKRIQLMGDQLRVGNRLGCYKACTGRQEEVCRFDSPANALGNLAFHP
jgi:hypothetical protein